MTTTHEHSTIETRLEAMQRASIPARHVQSRPVGGGAVHKHVPWDVTAAALNHYLGPTGWALQLGMPIVERTGQKVSEVRGERIVQDTAIVIVTATLNVLSDDGEIIASRSASGSCETDDHDAAGQATASAFRRAATLMGYSVITGAVCDCKPN